MAEKVIKNNESIAPFFGERMSFIRGLDPLGLQNISDATFSKLLPGLNNVTGRVRYYSFYCWLLDSYSKENGNTNPEHQKQFIRRAEYIIALAAPFFSNDSTSIPGSNYAKNEVNRKEQTVHSLQDGTYKKDGTTRDTYWNYSWGAFGQYYLGSLRDIGIISARGKEDRIYIRTNDRGNEIVSGELLANAFDQNIADAKKRLFLDSIKEGHITEDELQDLLPDFNLTKIPKETKEEKLLTKLLLQKDYPLREEEIPVRLRNKTIKHLFNFLKDGIPEFSDRAFVVDCYDKKGKISNKEDESLMGWYFYQFNEYWHYANTSILHGTLSLLDKNVGLNWLSLPELVNEVKDAVIEKYIALDLIRTGDDTVVDLLTKLTDSYSEDANLENTNNNTLGEKVAYAFLLIFSLFINNQKQLGELSNYVAENGLTGDGEGTAYFFQQFHEKKKHSIGDFIYDYIYLNIIYRHQYVAFRKMRGSNQSTQKFIIEDQYIRYLGNFNAAFTGPRINNLMSFLQDLNVVTDNHDLSERGLLILKNMEDGNN